MISSNKNFVTSQLQACLDEISKDSPIDCFNLTVASLEINLPILTLFIKILTHPLPKASTATHTKLDHVSFRATKFVRLLEDKEGYCSQENIQLFASALARGVSSISLNEGSYAILECLSNTSQLEFHKLSLRWHGSRRICDLVQKCVTLQDLSIDTDGLEEPLLLGECLANAFQLQKVTFKNTVEPRIPPYFLDDLVSNHGGDCIVGQLLSPRSRLKELVLQNMHLEDGHFLRIVAMLPTSLIQVLNVWKNRIGRQGILALAHQLPEIKHLKKVGLGNNPWEDDTRNEASCIAALVQGMVQNYSICSLNISRPDEQLRNCTCANVIRQIVATSHSIPVGLWPLILERVGTCSGRSTGGEDLIFPRFGANALYLILKNCPILPSVSQRTSPCPLRRSRRERKRVCRYTYP